MAFNITVKSFNATGVAATTTLNTIRRATVGARKKGVITPVGLIYPGRTAISARDLTFHTNPAASGVTGYLTLTSGGTYNGSTTDHNGSNPGSASPISPEVVAIEEFLTSVTDVRNVTSDGTTSTNFIVEAKKDVAAALHDVTVTTSVFKYEENGTVTILGEGESGFITTTYAQYTIPLTITAKWTGNDRLGILYEGTNYGIPV